MSALIPSHGKKTNNNKSGAKAAHKDALRKEAKERQDAYNKLSMTEKLYQGIKNGMGSKQRAKLILRAKKEGLVMSEDLKEKLNL